MSSNNNSFDVELNNFLELTSPPRKKSKINSNNNETITIPQSSRVINDLNLFKVVSVKHINNNNNIEIILNNINSNIQVACYLYDSW
jgi:hypothetical protein